MRNNLNKKLERELSKVFDKWRRRPKFKKYLRLSRNENVISFKELFDNPVVQRFIELSNESRVKEYLALCASPEVEGFHSDVDRAYKRFDDAILSEELIG